jgi:NTP pyrophosphatase (non-canonical NTP hydrolase)
MKNLQTSVEKFCTDNNLQCDAVARLLDLHSELGELSKEILKITNYGKNQIITKNKDLELEMGDALFSLICLANTLDHYCPASKVNKFNWLSAALSSFL